MSFSVKSQHQQFHRRVVLMFCANTALDEQKGILAHFPPLHAFKYLNDRFRNNDTPYLLFFQKQQIQIQIIKLLIKSQYEIWIVNTLYYMMTGKQEANMLKGNHVASVRMCFFPLFKSGLHLAEPRGLYSRGPVII